MKGFNQNFCNKEAVNNKEKLQLCKKKIYRFLIRFYIYCLAKETIMVCGKVIYEYFY